MNTIDALKEIAWQVGIEEFMEVDENDNVIFGKTFNNYFTTKEQTNFKI